MKAHGVPHLFDDVTNIFYPSKVAVKIQQYLNEREKYKVDLAYQRVANAWTPEDKQCFIDTIIREEPMPMFFLNLVDGVYYVVDGQQRLNCITQFYENKIKLSSKFSDLENVGRTFGGNYPLSDNLKQKFLNCDLPFHIVENYDDARVRLIFSRLQRGKPLTISGSGLMIWPSIKLTIMFSYFTKKSYVKCLF